MGWLDRILGVFRGRTPEVEDEPPAVVPPPAPAPAARAERAAAPEVARKPKEAKPARAPKPPKPPKPPREKGKKKARKEAARPPATPVAEVLSVEEAERRYGELVRAPAPAPTPAVAEPPAVAPAAEEPPPPLPGPDPVEIARRAAARAARQQAKRPRFEALLSRADALLAVPGARPRDWVAARRELVEGWERLGRPPEADEAELNAGRDARLAALDARLAAAAEAEGAARAGRLAEKRAIVEEARALAERAELKGAGPEMGALRARLRAVGPCAEEDDRAVAQAFAAAEARLKARQQELRAGRDAAREEGLARLAQLAAQAEALAGAADPEAAAQRAMGLQATWKTVRVPGPRGETDALWARFRAACDAVFAARAAAREAAGQETLQRLEWIVVRAELLASDGVEGDPEREIDALLAAWKKVGRAPRGPQQALWERLKVALDRIRTPAVDLSGQDDAALSHRPFEGLKGAE